MVTLCGGRGKVPSPYRSANGCQNPPGAAPAASPASPSTFGGQEHVRLSVAPLGAGGIADSLSLTGNRGAPRHRHHLPGPAQAVQRALQRNSGSALRPLQRGQRRRRHRRPRHRQRRHCNQRIVHRWHRLRRQRLYGRRWLDRHRGPHSGRQRQLRAAYASPVGHSRALLAGPAPAAQPDDQHQPHSLDRTEPPGPARASAAKPTPMPASTAPPTLARGSTAPATTESEWKPSASMGLTAPSSRP